MERVKEITRALRQHDDCLYAQNTHGNRIDIYRKNREAIYPPHYLFSLTDDWQRTGKPVPWGIEPLMARIRAMDLWRDDTFVEKWIEADEKRKASEDRAFKNNVESFLYDFRRQFARATNDVNTSTLEKVARKD